MWVGVGNGTLKTKSIKYSMDGKRWNEVLTGGFFYSTPGGEEDISNHIGYGVAYSPVDEMWVAVGHDTVETKSIQYSMDGKRWNDIKTGGFPLNKANHCIGYGVAYSPVGRMWIAVGDGNGIEKKSIQYSMDGKKWKPITKNGFSGVGRGVAYNAVDNMWVAVGSDIVETEVIQYSMDGKNWNKIKTGGFSPEQGYGIAYNPAGGTWMATGRVAPGTGKSIQHSTDGKNWNNTESGEFADHGYGVTYSPAAQMWMAVGIAADKVKTKTILYSTDGKKWNDITTGGFDTALGPGGFDGARGEGVAYSPIDQMWIAAGFNMENNSIQYSMGGKNWKPITAGGFALGGHGVACIPGLVYPGDRY